MKTQWTTRVRPTALAVARLALTGVASDPVLAADTRPATPLNGWNGKLGPGLWSSKPPLSGRADSNTQR